MLDKNSSSHPARLSFMEREPFDVSRLTTIPPSENIATVSNGTSRSFMQTDPTIGVRERVRFLDTEWEKPLSAAQQQHRNRERGIDRDDGIDR